MALNRKLIAKILCIVLLIGGAALLLPALVGFLYGETAAALSFLITGLVTAAAGFAGFRGFQPASLTLRIREGCIIVTFSWVLLALIGAVPFMVSGAIPGFCNAFFECMSGLTTTGATILDDIESLPHAILFWRAMTHWIGGMGILVFATAILPSLGIGGVQLVGAESSGIQNEKLSSKQSDTAKLLYLLYVGLTLLEIIFLLLGNMTFFDAVCHAFSTMGTGGFSTRSASIAAYNSPYIEWVITVFMLLAGVRFPFYFLLFRRKFKEAAKDTEVKLYFSIWAAATLIIFAALLVTRRDEPLMSSTASAYLATLPVSTLFRSAAFQTASILTTTGFGSFDYILWPYAARMIIFLLLFFGGCAGSTAGGIKTIRLLIYFKLAKRGVYTRIHPNAVVSIKVGGKALSTDVVSGVAAFLMLYVGVVFAGAVVVSFGPRMDLLTSLSASLSAVSNVGPGFGLIGPTCTYSFMAGWVKLFLAFLMLVGRLELYTVLSLFLPSFWNPDKY